MSGMNDNVAIIGDWLPPSPSPRSFFSAMLGDEISSKSNPEPLSQNEIDGFVLGPKDKTVVGNSEKKGAAFLDSFVDFGSFSELRSAPRGGLGDRIAARAGFNAPKLNTEGIRPNDVLNPGARSPLLMLSPGLSPTTLLESPVFLSNSLAQPSPTTGKFPYLPNGNIESTRLVSDGLDRSHGNNLNEDNYSTSFAFRPGAELSPSLFGNEYKVTQACPPQSDSSLQLHNSEQSKSHLKPEISRSIMERDGGNNNNNNGAFPSDQRMSDNHSSPLDEPQDDEGDQKGNGDSATWGSGAPSEDGYNWRKYGQKQVKGSEYPRSYYKCTHPSCQVKKKVERSHEGHITEIIYKGHHNHSMPQPTRRGVIGSPDMPEQVSAHGGTEADQGWRKNAPMAPAPEWRQDNFEVTSSPSEGPEFGNPNKNAGLATQTGSQLEPGEAVDASSTFSNEEYEDEQANGSVSLCYNVEEDESELKRRKIEAYSENMSGATRAIREPRVVVQTTSEVDILDDGYRWRKYGQKVVKGNPNPRSYYKCTSTGCTVRKHVERASHDLKSVITTYEGKHNHDVPAARNSSHGNSGHSSAQPVGSGVHSHIHRPESAPVRNGIPRFDASASGPLASFGLPGRPQLPPHGFSFGLNAPQGVANLTMAGLGAANGKMPMMPIHPFLASQQQQHQVSETGFMMLKGEPKPEPVSETGSNLLNNSSAAAYQQFMSRLPLGPQM